VGCFDGPNTPHSPPTCTKADFDVDGDVDLFDFGDFAYYFAVNN
jgi:hypothetical protein